MGRVTIFVALLLGIVAGYLGHFFQIRTKQRPSMVVDSSWIGTARSCWMGLSTFHDNEIMTYLSDQASFRSAFPGYATSTDSDVGLLAARTAPKDILLTDTSNRSDPKQSKPDNGVTASPAVEMKEGPWTEYAKQNQDENDPWKVVNEKKYICTVTDSAPAKFPLANAQTRHN